MRWPPDVVSPRPEPAATSRRRPDDHEVQNDDPNQWSQSFDDPQNSATSPRPRSRYSPPSPPPLCAMIWSQSSVSRNMPTIWRDGRIGVCRLRIRSLRTMPVRWRRPTNRHSMLPMVQSHPVPEPVPATPLDNRVDGDHGSDRERASIGPLVIPLCKELRRRNKAYLTFVAPQPRLICQRSPCDADHLKFAQARSLARKVSAEFTVPLHRTKRL
jgi:hypothetical protein